MTATESPATAREQTRARYPDEDGYIERDGVRLFYEVYGTGEPTVLLLPTWSIIHSRHWKAQIPYLARHARVITFDGRGNGRSDRPRGVEAYDEREFAADALAVMDATGTEQACIVGLSAGVLWGMLLAAEHPERVAGAVFIAPGAPFAQHLARVGTPFDQPLERYDGWAKYNLHHWRAGLPRLPGVLLRPGVHRAALDQAVRGLRGLGPRDRSRDARPHLPGPAAERPGRVRGAVPPGGLPGAGDARDRRRGAAGDRGRAGRRGDRRPVRGPGGRRALPARARPRARQPADPRVRASRGRRSGAGPARARGPSARCTSRRRSASGTPGATSPSPASCAGCIPICRSTGSPSTR